jgi:hypothetical protein
MARQCEFQGERCRRFACPSRHRHGRGPASVSIQTLGCRANVVWSTKPELKRRCTLRLPEGALGGHWVTVASVMRHSHNTKISDEHAWRTAASLTGEPLLNMDSRRDEGNGFAVVSRIMLAIGALPIVLCCTGRGVNPKRDCNVAACVSSSSENPSLGDERHQFAVVDFGRERGGALPPNGFLLSLPSLSVPVERFAELVDALEIGSWRVGSSEQAASTLAIGARTTVLLYESWRSRFPNRVVQRWP